MDKKTRLLHAGRRPEEQRGAVNPPVYHASTILYPSLAALEEGAKTPFAGVRYGRFGTPTTFALEEAVAEVEGGRFCVATPSGLAAICATLTAFLGAGDHVLVADTVYHPTRKFCDTVLARFGVETTYYDPLIGPGIRDFIRPNTKLVFVESPGSMTFEVQDIPAIAEVAHHAGAVVAMDNTWGVLNFQPFSKGVDVSIQACTKYIVGHSDAMLGAITTADEGLWRRIKATVAGFGYGVGADEAWLGLRGVRTLAVRLKQHEANGLALAEWLAGRPEVARVLHPGLPSDPGHALWRRDFAGACGLFGVVLKPVRREALAAMLDGLELFGMGFSWGGYESLIVPSEGRVPRTATTWDPEGPSLRIHAGLEDIDDLKADLERGFERLRRSA